MIENMKQHSQVADVVATERSMVINGLGKAYPLPIITIASSTAATSMAKPSISPQLLMLPTLPYKTADSAAKSGTAKMTNIIQHQSQTSLGFDMSIPPVLSSPSSLHKPVCETYTVGSGVYVSRVTNIHITGPCTRTQHKALNCAGDVIYNKRMCLDSMAVNDNTTKIPDKSSRRGKGMSQTRSLTVRRCGSGGGLYWPNRATYPSIVIPPQLKLPITTSSTSSINIPPSLITTVASTSTSQSGDTRLASFTVDQSESQGIVQEHKERRHIKAMNNAFQMLRRALPWAGGTVAEKRPLGASANKMNTLRLAVRYIRALEHLLEDNSEDDEESCSTSSSSQSSSCSPSPALSRTSLRSVGSDFSDLLSGDSLENLNALDELVALAEVESDAFMSDAKKSETHNYL